MKRFVFRLLCIALLLAGQQAALTHALAHATDRVTRSARVTEGARTPAPAKQGERYASCAFDYAFSQVLGAVHSACVPALQVDASFGTFALRAHARDAVSEFPFLIRGPPRHL